MEVNHRDQIAESLIAAAAALPQETGVYLFKDAEGKVLYVGKALRLKDRVRSYLAPDLAVSRHAGLVTMVRTAVTIEHEVVPTEIEALMLEARRIRQHQPRYNIRLRDDKSFVVIKIDLSVDFPTVTLGREKDLEAALEKARRAPTKGVRIQRKLDGVEYYGPFTSAKSVQAALKALRSVWPFRDCGPQKWATYSSLGHGCVFAHLGLCQAPCIGGVDPAAYRRSIDQLRGFLRGEKQQVVADIEAQMREASLGERYEEAALLRNRLYAVEHFRHVLDTFRDANGRKPDEPPFTPERDYRVECYDISNNQGQFAVGSLVTAVVRDGLVDAPQTPEALRERFWFERSRYRKFKIRTVEGISDVACLQEVLERRFKRGKGKLPHWSLPNLVLVDGGETQLAAAQQAAAVTETQQAIAAVAKGPTRKNVDIRGAPPEWPEESMAVLAELLREEAHRFAITYYRQVHRRDLFERGLQQRVPELVLPTAE